MMSMVCVREAFSAMMAFVAPPPPPPPPRIGLSEQCTFHCMWTMRACPCNTRRWFRQFWLGQASGGRSTTFRLPDTPPPPAQSATEGCSGAGGGSHDTPLGPGCRTAHGTHIWSTTNTYEPTLQHVCGLISQDQAPPPPGPPHRFISVADSCAVLCCHVCTVLCLCALWLWYDQWEGHCILV